MECVAVRQDSECGLNTKDDTDEGSYSGYIYKKFRVHLSELQVHERLSEDSIGGLSSCMARLPLRVAPKSVLCDGLKLS